MREDGLKAIRAGAGCGFRALSCVLLLLHAGLGRGAEAPESRVREILSPRELVVELGPGPDSARTGDIFLVRSQTDGETMGYVELSELPASGAATARARFLVHSENGLIRPGDRLFPARFQGANPDLLGRADLFSRGRRHHSARYKPLVYQGLVGETAATLDAGETLVDALTYVHHGITDKVSLSTLALANFILPNAAFKYQFLHTEWLDVSVALGGSLIREDDGIRLFNGSFTTYYDIKSNSKLVSHTAITVSYSPLMPEEGGGATLVPRVGSSIQSGYEYIFDNWDRLLLGPRYNFESRSVGGYIGYLFIWDHFHLSLNLSTSNITELRLGADAYLPYVFAFWRF